VLCREYKQTCLRRRPSVQSSLSTDGLALPSPHSELLPILQLSLVWHSEVIIRTILIFLLWHRGLARNWRCWWWRWWSPLDSWMGNCLVDYRGAGRHANYRHVPLRSRLVCFNIPTFSDDKHKKHFNGWTCSTETQVLMTEDNIWRRGFLDLPFEIVEMIFGRTRVIDLTSLLKSSSCIQVTFQQDDANSAQNMFGGTPYVRQLDLILRYESRTFKELYRYMSRNPHLDYCVHDVLLAFTKAHCEVTPCLGGN